ncbi:MAG: Flp pilus assembly protein CpaB [Anaerolineae bacterium]|nr:Flp pilus assembly protein CpaB [Anaerolineae bacterium]MDW7992604.1 Flp pilus assembly protein CpaB [Anaerolineae bacterium]
MGRRRTLVLVGVMVVGLALILGVLLLRSPRGGQGETPTEVPQSVKILIAANNLPRGMQIASEHILTQDWPVNLLPPVYYTDPAQVIGYFVRTDIPQGMPIMPSMLAPSAEAIGATGSLAALQVPEGQRAVAIPIDLLGAVAWAIQPGDHVDVLASWVIQDLDQEFQSTLPNQWAALQCGENQLCQGTYGRVELLPTGQVIMVYPSQQSTQGRYVAQVTIQDAVVLGVGSYQAPVALTQAPEQPSPAAAEVGVTRPATETPAQATPVPAMVTTQAVILVVDPQEALVLKALVELRADITLALRHPGDKARVATDAVSQDYIIARYNYIVPPKLPYAVSGPPANPLESQISPLQQERPAE